ncbi:MAG: methyltransferase domain-containing protein [Verrucomicrobia bacterium]|nr:methyltransferase domain-containing protein [Verrucomicrobiota bacterium]MDA1065088.1 methyltransferase domain-containing protein [Verrucomicrobiota bacterium]
MKWRSIIGIILIGTLSIPAFAQKESVNPGINASYLKEGLIIEEWIERLEAEGREVFDNREAIVNALGLKPGMSMVDVGTGTGAHLPYLSAKVQSSGTVYAVDIVPEFLEHIDKQIEANGWKNIETVQCTERSIEVPDNSVDLALICNVYHHFEYPSDSLASIHKALRKGGRIALIDFKRIPGVSTDWILSHMRAGQEVFENEIKEAGFKKTGEVDYFLTDNYMVIFEKIE